MPILPDYHHFDGLHWATGYLTNALAYQGVTAPHTGQPYSEALLMGINGGLCAGYFAFEYVGYDPHLHFLTRYLYDEEPGAVFERLAIPMTKQQTTDPTKAAANVINALARGKAAIVWVDVTMLDNSRDKPAEEYYLVMPVLVYGYEGEAVHIADRAHVPLIANADNFTAARARVKKHKHRMMTLDAPDARKLPGAVMGGIQTCIDIFVNEPPVGNKSSFGFDAYQKWAKLLTSPAGKGSWSKMFAPGRRMYCGLQTAYQYLELFFTGGNGARGVYADFLDEGAIILEKPALKTTAEQFRVCASAWGDFVALLLPDSVAPFKETRELMRRDYDVFLAKGGAAGDERRGIAKRLEAIKDDMDAHFPLTEAEAKTMREGLAEGIMKVHDAEKLAIDMLCESVKA